MFNRSLAYEIEHPVWFIFQNLLCPNHTKIYGHIKISKKENLNTEHIPVRLGPTKMDVMEYSKMTIYYILQMYTIYKSEKQKTKSKHCNTHTSVSTFLRSSKYPS